MKNVTRRAFVAMLGAAAALLRLPKSTANAPPPKSDAAKPTIWIGHF